MGMDATAALATIEALLAALPVAEREALLDAVELYGDVRADEVLAS
jgi:hypothetical protein